MFYMGFGGWLLLNPPSLSLFSQPALGIFRRPDNGPAAINRSFSQSGRDPCGPVKPPSQPNQPTNSRLASLDPIKPSNFKERKEARSKTEKKNPGILLPFPPLSQRLPSPSPPFSPSAVEIQRSPTTVGARFASNLYRSPATYAGKGGRLGPTSRRNKIGVT